MLKIQVLCDVMPFQLVNSYHHFEVQVGLPNPEDEGTMVVQNVSNYSPVDMAQHPRRLDSSPALL
jgi:hypothetical protein